MIRGILSALLFVSLVSLVRAVPPEDGNYWDPAQSGRGYVVETQNDDVFVTIYNYTATSSPSFYVIQGKWDDAQRRIRNAELLEVTSGPWVGAPFSPVGQIVSRGPANFEFPTPTTARFVYNGQTTRLQRFVYGYGTNANSLLRGLWHTTEGTTLTFGEMMVVTGSCTISSCSTLTEPFVGSLNGQSARILLGSRMPDGRVMILVDSSTNYYNLYVFELRVNRWVGWNAAFLKTATTYPTSGLPMIAHRIYGPAYVSSSGVNLPKGRVMGDERDQLNELRTQAGGALSDVKSFSAEEVNAFVALRNALSEIN